MRIRILTLIITIIAAAALYAQHYTLHSATKGVTVESGGRTVAATEGMPLKATDCLNIPEGGHAEILNSLDKRIYSSVRPGKVSVTKLLIEARQSATDKLATVSNKIKLKRNSTAPGKRVYVEKGMVSRTLDTVCAAQPDTTRMIQSDSIGTCCRDKDVPAGNIPPKTDNSNH